MKRFWNLVAIAEPSDCWPWLGSKNPKGYGYFKLEGRVWRAHRVAYFLVHGALFGKQVMHSCDNPSCCNPAHLSLGTNADNMADMIRKGRQSRHGGARGERHQSAKLTAAKVADIRNRLASGATAKGLAREYGVSSKAVDKIRHRRTWA